MNKKMIRIAGWALGLSMAVAGIGLAMGTSAKGVVETKAAVDLNTEEVNYTLSMKANSTDTDSETALTGNATGTYLVGGTDYVSSVSSSKCYLGKSSYSALKFGSSKEQGSITFTLAAEGQVKATNIVFHFGAYDTGKQINFSVNGKTSGTGFGSASTPAAQGTFTDYTLACDGTTDITSITVEAAYASKYRFYLSSITVYTAKAADPDAASVSIINGSNGIAPHGVAMPLSAEITNDDNYTVTWSCDNPNVTLSSTTGTNVTITASNAIASGTKITITAALDDPNEAYNVTSFRVATVSGDSVSNALIASEAKTLVLTGDFDGSTLYVKGYANNATNRLVWLSDNPDTTQTFELYNGSDLPATYSDGTYIVGHGSAAVYKTTTAEAIDAVIDSADYFALGQTAVEVNNTQSVSVTASSATGTIVWNAVSGTGSVSLSNQSNTGVTITGTSVGTATVTATVGNLTKSISVTIAKYATDWAYKDIVLEADPEFKDGYYIGDTLDTAHLTVTYIEHSVTLDEDREHEIDLGLVVFNFDSSAAGSFNLTATYQGHTSDDVIPVTVAEAPEGIEFNTAGLKISTTSPYTGSAEDSNGVTWNATATFSGSPSITNQSNRVQVGSGSNRADSVVITANMGSVKTFTKLAFTFSAFNGDTGAVSMKLDGNEIAAGNISGTTVVTVEPEDYVRGQAIQIDVENEGHLRVNLLSVEYNAYSDDEMVTKFVNENMHMSHTTNDGSCTSQGWYTAAKTAYGKLFSQQKSLFNSESKYADAKARLIKWAEINKETFDPAAGTFSAAATFSPLSVVSSSSMPLVITVATLGAAGAAGFFLFQRKRKEF